MSKKGSLLALTLSVIIIISIWVFGRLNVSKSPLNRAEQSDKYDPAVTDQQTAPDHQPGQNAPSLAAKGYSRLQVKKTTQISGFRDLELGTSKETPAYDKVEL